MSKRGATKIVAPETRTIRGSIGRFEKEVRQQCLLNFLRMAGIDSADYDTSRDVINHAAELLSVPRSDLDHSIWKYMG